MAELLVSVIIPTYNRSKLLAEAIQSVISQTYRPIECIVVDDGSTDDTKKLVEVLEKEADTLFTLQYIYQNNSGAQIARNTGTSAASGDFIQYLDSDDLLYADKLQKQVGYLNFHSECDAVFGDWEKGNSEEKEIAVAYKGDNLITQFLTEKCIHTLSILMRSSLVKKIGYWDINIKRNQEVDYHLRGVLAGGKFDYQPGLCGLWRVHDGERIVSTTGIGHILQFYKKWELLLRKKNMFSVELSNKIAQLYMWLVSQNKNIEDKQLILILKEAIRLDPEIAFYQNKNLRLLMNAVGKNIALKIWLRRFRQTTRESVES